MFMIFFDLQNAVIPKNIIAPSGQGLACKQGNDCWIYSEYIHIYIYICWIYSRDICPGPFTYGFNVRHVYNYITYTDVYMYVDVCIYVIVHTTYVTLSRHVWLHIPLHVFMFLLLYSCWWIGHQFIFMLCKKCYTQFFIVVFMLVLWIGHQFILILNKNFMLYTSNEYLVP